MKKITIMSQPIIFQQKEIRRIWYKKEWFWVKMKKRNLRPNQLFPFWEQLKLIASDGKMYLTNCTNKQGILNKLIK